VSNDPYSEGTPFTRTWIYGVYDGRITFYEEMVSLAYMLSKPSACSKFGPNGLLSDGFMRTV
jgi:hypothetical protein